MKKVFSLLLAIMLMVFGMTACGNPGGTAKTENNEAGNATGDQTEQISTEEGGEILVWVHIESWGAAAKEEFEKKFPEYTVTYEVTNNLDMLQKFQTTKASGGRLPDVLFLDLMDGGSVVTSDKASDLFYDMTAEPFNLNKDELVDWVADIYSDKNGSLYGLEIGPAPSTYLVRKSMAEKYLGTTDPDEISEKLASWEDVVELGRRIKAEGNGEEYLAANLNELIGILKQNSKGLFEGTKCNIKENLNDEFEILHTLASEDLVDTLEAEGPEIPAAMESDNYFMWQCAMWQPQWTYMASAPNSAGEWILMTTPPGGKMFVGGGMPIVLPKGSQNPMGGFKFVSYFRATMDGSAFTRDNFGDVSLLKEAYKDDSFHKSPQAMIDYFGVDVIAQYAKYISNTEVLELTPYDKVLWSDAVKIAFQKLESGGSAQEAEQAMVDELVRVYPEITQ
ncbi:MAG: carbohydrate ABC transporter substrate-binding protein [Lachnospiraceae bacterium]|nr:carbohydrate ABC transporter substrate-binding protein [Lachnospiraceae bacterium]